MKRLDRRNLLTIVAIAALVVGAIMLLFVSPPEPSAAAGAAEATGAAAPPTSPGYGGILLKMVVSLVVVCAFAYLFLRWALKRFSGSGGTGKMEVVARLAVAPNRSVLVVRVGDRHLIVGSGEQQLSLLGELSAEEARQLADDPAPPSESSGVGTI